MTVVQSVAPVINKQLLSFTDSDRLTNGALFSFRAIPGSRWATALLRMPLQSLCCRTFKFAKLCTTVLSIICAIFLLERVIQEFCITALAEKSFSAAFMTFSVTLRPLRLLCGFHQPQCICSVTCRRRSFFVARAPRREKPAKRSDVQIK